MNFELASASETHWKEGCDPADLVLTLEERDEISRRVRSTRFATLSNMPNLANLGPRLAVLALKTAQAELNAGGPAPAAQAPVTGPEPHVRLGDDVVVCDFDWDRPKWHSPRDWIFHDVKRGRRLFQVRKSDLGQDPSVEVLVALLTAFAAGERAGKDTGRIERGAALAGEMRSLIGVPA